MRSASRRETRLTLNCSTSTSWRGRGSPSASSPSMIWRRNSSATISAILGADNRRRASGPIPRAVIQSSQLEWLSYFSSNGINTGVSRGSESRPTPLHDLRVIEISDRIAGSYCGKLLVDAGAQVRKIEPPQGDSLRRYSAGCSPVPHGSTSPFYSYLNADNRSMTNAADSERLRAELAAADVVVVTAGRSQAEALGIDPRRLLADSP